MKYILSLAVVGLIALPNVMGQPKAETLAAGLKYPLAVEVGPGGKIYVTTTDDPHTIGTGAVLLVENGNSTPVAAGLDAPHGMATFQGWLFVAGRQQVWRIDANGKVEVFVSAAAFPSPPECLVGITVDPESSTLFVADMGDFCTGKSGAIYRITRNRKVNIVADAKTLPSIVNPTYLRLDGQSHLLVAGIFSNEVRRIKLADGTSEKYVDGLEYCNSFVWDRNGRLLLETASGARPGLQGSGWS